MDPLVLYVPFPMLHPVIDATRLASIHPNVEVVTSPTYDISHQERNAREKDPFGDATRAMAAPLTEEQAAAFARADVLWTLDAPLDLPTVAPRLRFVQTIGSGIGQYVASRLPEGGIEIANGAGLGAVPIAEWTLARILQIYKQLPAHDANAREHRWQSLQGSVVQGRTVVVVGLGAIGREVARRCRAFGMPVIGVRRSATPGATDPDVDELVTPAGLHDALGRADVVVLAAPGTAETDDLFDAAAFAAMPQGSVFVNVARGTLVVEPALIEALRSGHLRGAAIDVARTEPLPAADPLWDAPNLLISPHSSTSGEGYAARAFDLLCTNLECLVQGRALVNRVDLSGGY
jgi:phosphoglycerate dehydrogenase-like enzyme